MAPSAIKRLATEQRNMCAEANRVSDIYAAPREDNIYEWHFTIRGPNIDNSPFKQGLYHGALMFTSSYPFEPPDIIFFTPNGRFTLHSKICSTISSFHRETWKPAFTISLILTSLRSFMAQEDEPGVGAISKGGFTSADKERLAKESWDYKCSGCGRCARDIWEEEMKMYPESNNSSSLPSAAAAATASSAPLPLDPAVTIDVTTAEIRGADTQELDAGEHVAGPQQQSADASSQETAVRVSKETNDGAAAVASSALPAPPLEHVAGEIAETTPALPAEAAEATAEGDAEPPGIAIVVADRVFIVTVEMLDSALKYLYLVVFLILARRAGYILSLKLFSLMSFAS